MFAAKKKRIITASQVSKRKQNIRESMKDQKLFHSLHVFEFVSDLRTVEFQKRVSDDMSCSTCF